MGVWKRCTGRSKPKAWFVRAVSVARRRTRAWRGKVGDGSLEIT